MQKSLSKESSRPKVRAQKNPAPGFPGFLGVRPSQSSFPPTNASFPIRLQPIRFCQGWLSIFPFCGHPAGCFPGPSVRSVPGQECWWPSPSPLAEAPWPGCEEPETSAPASVGRPGPRRQRLGRRPGPPQGVCGWHRAQRRARRQTAAAGELEPRSPASPSAPLPAHGTPGARRASGRGAGGAARGERRAVDGPAQRGDLKESLLPPGRAAAPSRSALKASL